MLERMVGSLMGITLLCKPCQLCIDFCGIQVGPWTVLIFVAESFTLHLAQALDRHEHDRQRVHDLHKVIRVNSCDIMTRECTKPCINFLEPLDEGRIDHCGLFTIVGWTSNVPNRVRWRTQYTPQLSHANPSFRAR